MFHAFYFRVLHFHVLHFHVQHFHVLHFHPVRSTFSCPAISCPAYSCLAFSPLAIPMVRHFHLLHFQSTRGNVFFMESQARLLVWFAESSVLKVESKSYFDNLSNCCQATATRAMFGDTVTVSGCYFHYGQALMKRLKKIGLTNAYRNKENTQKVFRCLLALRLLPVTDIDLAFKDMIAMVAEDSRRTSEDPPGTILPLRPKQWLTSGRRGCLYETILRALTTQ